MKKGILDFLLAAGIFVWGCASKDSQEPTMREWTFQATYTKAAISSGGVFSWQKADQIAVWNALGGMLVYHIDRSNREFYLQGYGNVVPGSVWGNDDLSGHYNANPDHPLWYLVPAASNYNYSLTASNATHQKMIPFPGTKNVVNYNPISWNNVETDVSLTGIDFSNTRNYIAFNANCRNFPMINNPGHGVYPAGSAFNLRINYGSAQKASSLAWYLDGESVGSSSVTLAAGPHKVQAVLSYSDGTVRRINLQLRAD